MKCKKTAPTLLIVLLLYSCNMLSPSYLCFENGSDYPIILSYINREGERLELKPGGKEFRPLHPGEYLVKVEIEEIGFSREYSIKIAYLERSRFIFKTDS